MWVKCISHGKTLSFVWKFYILIIISEDSASYFLKMSMLINFVYTLIQAKMVCVGEGGGVAG